MQFFENGGLADHIGELPLMNVTTVDAYFARPDEVMAAKGYERVRGTKAMQERDSVLVPAVKIDDLMSPHIAKDMDTLARAIQAVDINSPLLADYDRWLNLLRAMWQRAAAVGASTPARSGPGCKATQPIKKKIWKRS